MRVNTEGLEYLSLYLKGMGLREIGKIEGYTGERIRQKIKREAEIFVERNRGKIKPLMELIRKTGFLFFVAGSKEEAKKIKNFFIAIRLSGLEEFEICFRKNKAGKYFIKVFKTKEEKEKLQKIVKKFEKVEFPLPIAVAEFFRIFEREGFSKAQICFALKHFDAKVKGGKIVYLYGKPITKNLRAYLRSEDAFKNLEQFFPKVFLSSNSTKVFLQKLGYTIKNGKIVKTKRRIDRTIPSLVKKVSLMTEEDFTIATIVTIEKQTSFSRFLIENTEMIKEKEDEFKQFILESEEKKRRRNRPVLLTIPKEVFDFYQKVARDTNTNVIRVLSEAIVFAVRECEKEILPVRAG